MMKRSAILLLVLTLLFSSFSVASAATGAEQVVNNFNILPATCSADSDKLVTRSEFAYTIANILGSGKMDPMDTAYGDVTADLEDSGYIHYATVNGFLLPTGSNFCPSDPISFHDFNEAVVRLLAYETIATANGGGKAGNLKTVMDLKMYTGVEKNDYETVTVKQYRKLIYNLLTTKVSDFTYTYDSEGKITLRKSNTSKTILSQYFGISRYYGSITEVNNVKQSAKVRITKNVSENNPTILGVGEDYYFLSDGTVDLNFYLNIPVELWADKDGNLIYIAPQDNVQVFYDVIYSVNNDTDKDHAYAISLVEKIEFLSDDTTYKIAPGAQVCYNGNVVGYPVKLAEKYAKIVVIDNQVTYVETWDLVEGGIVSELNNGYLGYMKGEAEGRVQKLAEYENIMVVIEGRSTDRNQIKLGSLFWYYQTDDQLVIVVSEKSIVGTLDSISGDEIEIGRQFYPISDIDNDLQQTGDIYCSVDGEYYFLNDYKNLFDKTVTAYIDIFGNVKYVKADDRISNSNEFTAYVMGSSQKGFDDRQMKLMKIHPVLEEITVTLPTGFNKYIDNPATTSYGIAQLQTNLNAPLSWADKMNAYEKLFKFTINDDGVITSISEPDYYLLFGEAHDVETLDTTGTSPVPTFIPVPCLPAINIPLDHFTGDYRAIYMPTTSTNGVTTGIGSSLMETQLFYIRDERFLVLHNLDGKVGVKEMSYNDLLAHGTFNMSDASLKVNIAMVAGPTSSSPDFWFLYGNTDKIHIHQGDDDAVIDSITLKYDEEADKNYYEVVLDNGELEWELDTLAIDPSWSVTHYRPAGQPAPDKLEVGMKVEYMDGALFCANEMYITGVEEYPKSADGSDMTMQEWYENIMPGYLRGTVKKITDARLYMENGGAYAIGSNCSISGVKFVNGKVVYESLSEADVMAGSTIYYNRTTCVNSIFVELVD